MICAPSDIMGRHDGPDWFRITAQRGNNVKQDAGRKSAIANATRRATKIEVTFADQIVFFDLATEAASYCDISVTYFRKIIREKGYCKQGGFSARRIDKRFSAICVDKS